ncbi:jg26201, partial [Pararge aegeria aegeria]
MGDFNTCLLKNDFRASRLKSMVQAANLRILPLSATHSFPNCTASLLDLVLVSSLDYVAKHGQCPADAFSYHDLLYLSYKIRPPKAKSRMLLQRNFSGMNLERLLEDAAKADWDDVRTGISIDEQVNIFNSILTKLYDVHAPIRPVRIKHLPAPWLTEEIKTLQHKKNVAKSKFKSNATDSNRDKYKVIRNRCNRLCRDKQRRHIHKSVLEEEDSGRVWKFLKSLGVGKANRNIPCNNVNLNQLNKHFSSSCTIDSTTKLNTKNQILALPTPNDPAFIFSQIDVSDVKRCIIEVNSDAVGTDSISRKMITPLLEILAPIITFLFNNSINTGLFPSSWKNAQ